MIPPRPYRGTYPCSDLNLTLKASQREINVRVNEQDGTLTKEEQECLISSYDEEFSYLDAEMSNLFTALRNEGIYDDTLVIVTSDHGEAFGEHRLVGHGNSIYHEVTSIPLLIKYPGQEHAATVDHQVSQLDLLPTVLDVAGIHIPAPRPGQSLYNLEDSREEPLVQESYEFGGDRIERGILWDGWKLIASTDGKRELYRIADDPKETEDLVDLNPDQAARMEHLLDEWLDQVQPLTTSQEKTTDQIALE